MFSIIPKKPQIDLHEVVNIGYITGTLGIGGAEQQLFFLITNIDRKKYKPYVINLDPEGDCYWRNIITEYGIDVIEIHRGNRISRLLNIRSVIRNNNIKILQGFNFYVNGYAVLASWPNIKSVIGGLRNLPVPAHLNKVPSWWRWLCFNKVRYLVCNSYNAYLLLQKVYPSLANSLFIPNAMPIVKSNECERLREIAKNKLGICNNEIVIGFVGNLSKQKNIPLLLKVIPLIVKDFPLLKVIIVGDGIMLHKLQILVRKMRIEKYIRFVGKHPNAINIMPGFDLLCLPSNYEGMPNVLMEAAAVGLPVVASNIAGVPEIVKNKQTGLLFPVNDCRALEKSIRALLVSQDKRLKMGQEARKYIEQTFSISKMVCAYEELYSKILSRGL